MNPPLFDDDLCLTQAVEQLTVQQFIAEAGVEAFAVSVFPCTARQGIALRCPERGEPGSMYAVFAPSAAIRTDEMGACSPYPVDLYQHDETTQVQGPFFLINYGNVNQGSVLAEQSNRLRQDPFRKNVWRARQTMKDDDLCVARSVLNGPGIWVDDRFEYAFFLSGEIVQAMKKNGFVSKQHLKKCRLV